MSKKISRLATHRDTDEACRIISFLNEQDFIGGLKQQFAMHK